VLLTLSALFLVWLAGFIPLPGLDRGALAEVRAQGGDFGLLMLGVRPLLVSLVLVEIGAWALPWTRARRRTDPALRRILWIIAALLALPIAWMQGIGVALSLEQLNWGWHDYLVISPGWAFRLGIASLLALATAGLTLLARGLDRHGLGPGLAALLLLGVAVDGAQALSSLGRGLLQGAIPLFGVVATVAGLAACAAAAAWALGRRPRRTRDLFAGLPVTGFFPMELALLVLMVPVGIAPIAGYHSPWVDALTLAHPAGVLLSAAVILLATPLAATLFHWRRRAWWQGPERRAWLMLMAASAAFLLAVLLVQHVAMRLAPSLAGLGAVSLVAGVALALDAWEEISLWRRAAGSAPQLFREDQDLADSLEALDTLHRDDPRGHYVLCGRRFRSLTYFFGPWVPLRILGVPGPPPEAESS
jgi:hypothetical protein